MTVEKSSEMEPVGEHRVPIFRCTMQAIEDKQRNDGTEWQSRRFVASETKIGKYKLGGSLVFQRASEGD